MSLSVLRITDFRNFCQQNIEFNSTFNFFVGDNGSGKTSLLEAIYYLSHGRSFLVGNHSKVIRFEQENFVLSADITVCHDPAKIGLRRFKNGNVDISIDGHSENRVSQLAKFLPVQLITPESFSLFYGGPKERRQFYDFGLFHVKQSFFTDWLRFSKILKHRNALLKRRPKQYNVEFEYWDGEFARLANSITKSRFEYLDLFRSEFESTNLNVESFLSCASVSFELMAGYNSSIDLSVQLKNSFERDVRFGYTSMGPHRADVKIKSDQRYVEDVFSRGQMKLLLYVVKLLQSKIISKYNLTPIMLIDDIGSELDRRNLTKIFEFLNSATETQFFISSLNREIAGFMAPEKYNHAMFHVKHGTVNRQIGT